MKVVFRSGPRSDEEVEIDRDIVVGREGTDIEIEDSAVSRRHALLRPLERGVEIEDLGSTNGTYVNGAKIDSPTTLEPGDFVNIGQSTLEIGGVDWRSAETQALSIPAEAEDVEDREEYVPTASISVADDDSRSFLSNVPKAWLVVGGALILLILVAVAIASLTGGESRDEILAEADSVCRRVQKARAGTQLTPKDKPRALRRDATRLLQVRASTTSTLRKLEVPDDVNRSFAAYLVRTTNTDDRLRAVRRLKGDPKERAVKRAVAAVRDAARAERKAAREAGLRVCGGLPV